MARRISPWVLDTSILVSFIRSGRYRVPLLAGFSRRTTFVPGIVLCELYAGAMTREDRGDIEALRRALGPQVLGFTALQWATAGRCLAFYAARWGRIRPRDHVADVVIAVTALEVGGVLVSENVEHMRRWSLILNRVIGGMKLQVRALRES